MDQGPYLLQRLEHREPGFYDIDFNSPSPNSPAWTTATSHQSLPTGIRDHRRTESFPERQDSTTHLTPGYSPENQSQKHVLIVWAAEIAWFCFSLVCLGAIIGVLLAFDHQHQPDWPLGATINSVIAFLATICRVAFTIPVIEGVSQMKWNWYRRKARPLAHLEVFDKASRGPWGSIRLLFVMRGRVLALVIFVIMISGFLTSALTQAAISIGTLPCEALGKECNPDDPPIVPSSGVLPDILKSYLPEIKVATQIGITTPPDQEIPFVEPTCNTGDCDFPRFNTVGVCAATHNVTHLLEVSEVDKAAWREIIQSLDPFLYGESHNKSLGHTVVLNASLPNGVYLAGGTKLPNINVSVSADAYRSGEFGEAWTFAPKTLTFNDEKDRLGSAVLNFFIIWINKSYFPRGELEEGHPKDPRTAHAFRAAEVLLHFCVKTYDVSVRSGHTTTELVRTETTVQTTNGTLSFPKVNETVPTLVILKAQKDQPSSFGVLRGDFELLFFYLRRVIKGIFVDEFDDVHGETITSDAFGSAFLSVDNSFQGNWDDEETAPISIPDRDSVYGDMIGNISRNLADSWTNAVRKRYGVFRPSPYDEDDLIKGTELHANRIIVRWQWLILLIAQIAISGVFLVAVMIQTWSLQVDVVKSEVLPVLLAVNPEEKETLLGNQRDEDVESMRQNAPRIVGGLQTREFGWSLR
ncbi:Fc.00g061960.m01.CDS01 [Cosmosporella sp. VM-42]